MTLLTAAHLHEKPSFSLEKRKFSAITFQFLFCKPYKKDKPGPFIPTQEIKTNIVSVHIFFRIRMHKYCSMYVDFVGNLLKLFTLSMMSSISFIFVKGLIICSHYRYIMNIFGKNSEIIIIVGWIIH